jgi:RHS repeat-associated protein
MTRVLLVMFLLGLQQSGNAQTCPDKSGFMSCSPPTEGPDWCTASVGIAASSRPQCQPTWTSTIGARCGKITAAIDAMHTNLAAPWLGQICNGPASQGLVLSRTSAYTTHIRKWFQFTTTFGTTSGQKCGVISLPGEGFCDRPLACPPNTIMVDPPGPGAGDIYCAKPKWESCPANNPIQCAGGDKLQTETDFAGASNELHFKRFYSSAGIFVPRSVSHPRSGLMYSWRHSFQQSLVLEPAAPNSQDLSVVYLVRPDGDYRYFSLVNGSWVGRLDAPEKLLETSVAGVRTGWIYTLSNDDQERYDTRGFLQSITSKNGRTLTFTYSDANTPPATATQPDLLLQVTNDFGRSIQLQYDSVGKLVRMIDPAGAAYQYRFDGRDRLVAVEYPDGTSKGYLYDEPGLVATSNMALPLLSGIVSESGVRFSTYKYDANGRAFEEWHGNSGLINKLTLNYSYSYSSPTSTTVLTDALGAVRTRRFVMIRGIVKDAGVIEPCGTIGCSGTQSKSINYDANGYRDTQTDFKGNVTDYDHDARGLEIRRIDAKNTAQARITETHWSATIRVPTERRVCAANTPNTCPTTAVAPNLLSKTQMTYNTRGQLLSTTQIDPTNASNTRVSSSTYCDVVNTTTCPLVGLKLTDNGPRTDVTDVTTYAYRMSDAADLSYRKGDLWKITNANAHVVEYLAYHGAGRVLKMKDPNGVETWMSYHPRGWLLSRTVKGAAVALDATTTFVYTPFGAIERVTQPDGSYTQYSYDQAQRLIAINDGLNNRIDYTLDAAGNRINEATRDSGNVLKRSMAREYDQLSRLRASLRAGVLNADPISKKTSYTYDANGNQELMTDPMIGTTAGTVSDNDYDPLNRLIKTLQDVGGINAKVEYQYDALDRLTTVKDPKNLNTVYSYDGLGNQISLNSPDTGVTSFTYDAAGNRTSQTDARGVVSNMTYDVLNRLLTISYPSDTSKNVSFTYDTNQSGCATGETLSTGRLTSMSDATGSTKLCYDYLGLVRRKIQVSGGQSLTMQYRYDLAGRLNSLTYPSGAMVNYTRDSQGRLLTAVLELDSTTVQLVTNASYLPFGPIDRLTFGNGQFLNKAYDQNYDIDAITGGLSLDFSVDEVGNIRQIQSGTATQKYGYDKLYRLQDVRDQNQSLIEAFTYDATGNRLTQQDPGGTESYSYPATNHRLTQLGPVARTQDAVGNTLTGIPGFGGDAASYDVRNRLSAVGANRYKANFNARGERVFKGAQSAVATDWVNPGLTATLYDESGQVLSYRRSGSTITHEEIVWFGNTPIARFTSSGSTITAVHAIHTDHLNSPRALANARTQGGQAAGITVWSWDLIGANASGSNAFGSIAANEDVDANGTVVKFDLRFPGQQYDSETNLNYNYFRDYEAGAGRYVESDPIGLRGGVSTFGYVDGRPTQRIDPSGLMFTSMCLGPLERCYPYAKPRVLCGESCLRQCFASDNRCLFRVEVAPKSIGVVLIGISAWCPPAYMALGGLGAFALNEWDDPAGCAAATKKCLERCKPCGQN